ncbi:hypothetical protein OCK74_05620 [Chitinophagaceae bacterium LB-8]|uniref:Uncharacterized protein n=1 Tax=Paraflavisolibacter caeni TaxID=2982496 RepID=A0A9X2XSY8_9BACT|nr:hypothetical protein [Paraflavisolibacter caeni]MCU7548584.1 hypothetical protein [Paraflavisolibacter caeni]
MDYKRNIHKRLLFNRLTFAILLAGIILIIIFKSYTYLALFAIAYFILDFIFPLYQVSITDTTLTIRRFFAGGLLQKGTKIEKSKINEIRNIDTSITTNSQIDFEYGVFAPGDVDNQTKKYEIFKIKYAFGENNKSIKVPLLQLEADILNRVILPTT